MPYHHRTCRLLSACVGFAILTACGCQKPQEAYWPLETGKDYSKPLPPGEVALRKIDPADYPDFSKAYFNRARLEEAIENSLSYLAKPSSKKYFPYSDISHTRAVASLQRLQSLLSEISSPQDLDAAIKRDFEVYQSVGCDDIGTVWFTGYYTPIFEGRKQPDARFKYPLYSMPPDLVKDSEGKILGRKTADGSTVPYHTRRQIEEGQLMKGKEIAWLKDPFEVYVVTVQGSAKLKLEDGSYYELGYAANNGHEYTPVASAMIEDGVLSKDEVSLQKLLEYFASHPQDINKYCWKNDRFVFFKESKGGPYGSINVPVIPYRSIATDKEVYPRACIAFLQTNLPMVHNGNVKNLPYSGFSLDQDTGGAIRAPGRCDIYMGVGPGAEALAGRTGAEGKLYYIFVKNYPPDLGTPPGPAPQPRGASSTPGE